MRKILVIFLWALAPMLFSCNEQEGLRQAIQMNLPHDVPSVVIPGQLIYFNVYPSSPDQQQALGRLGRVEVYKDGNILYSSLPRTGYNRLGFKFSYVIQPEDLGKRLVFKFNGVLDNNVMASADLGVQVIDSYDKIGFFQQDSDFNDRVRGTTRADAVLLVNGIKQVAADESDLTIYYRSNSLGNYGGFASPLPFQLSSVRTTRFFNIPNDRKGSLNFDGPQALVKSISELTEGINDGHTLVDFEYANGQWFFYSSRNSNAGIIRVNYLHNRALGFTVYGLYIKP
ncbi:hypothetical protein FUAX_36640 [Fulvitalea axinellae]|uniref:DUF4397 domain-containing protein n=1 Tax=Fulvitalea axinellae TaxID=1182444 RepID=A0AAU9CTA7_9BACT|nr:hypothetical protein FUAX_36640 [Fulvitalea axinellae]